MGPAGEDLEHVPHGRAGGGRDQAQALGQGRERPLALGGEEPLAGQLGLELLEGELQLADALGLHLRDDELQGAAARVDLQLAAHQHRQTVLQLEAQAVGEARPHRAVEHPVAVLELEVAVPGAGDLDARHLAPHPDLAEPLEAGVDRGDQLAHRPDLRGHLRSELTSPVVIPVLARPCRHRPPSRPVSSTVRAPTRSCTRTARPR